MVTSMQSINALTNAPQVGVIDKKETISAASDQQNEGRKKQALSNENIHAVVQELNHAMKIVGTNLTFSIDQATKRTVVRVTDSETHEVIRQIPSEEMLRVSQRIAELLGVLFDHAG